MFANAHTREHGHTLVRILFGDVIKSDLPVIPHHVVRDGHDADTVQAEERWVGRIGDIDVHLDPVLQPILAVLTGANLQQH